MFYPAIKKGALCVLFASLCLLSLSYITARIVPPPANPYAPLFAADVNTLDCFSDYPSISTYCVQYFDNGYLAYGVQGSRVQSVSGRGVFDMRVGDFVAIYGQPTRIYRNRTYTTYQWQTEGLRITVLSRRDSYFEGVRWCFMVRG